MTESSSHFLNVSGKATSEARRVERFSGFRITLGLVVAAIGGMQLEPKGKHVIVIQAETPLVVVLPIKC